MGPQVFLRLSVDRAIEDLGKFARQLLESTVEFTILGTQAVDFLDRVHDGRVVFVVELLSDLRIREIGDLFAQVHGYLPWKDDLLRILTALDLADLEAIVVRHGLDDVASAYSRIFGKDVFQSLFGELQR